MKEKLFDVVAVNLETSKVRFMAQGKTLRNAEAIVNMSVMRRGVELPSFNNAPLLQAQIKRRIEEFATWIEKQIDSELL